MIVHFCKPLTGVRWYKIIIFLLPLSRSSDWGYFARILGIDLSENYQLYADKSLVSWHSLNVVSVSSFTSRPATPYYPLSLNASVPKQHHRRGRDGTLAAADKLSCGDTSLNSFHPNNKLSSGWWNIGSQWEHAASIGWTQKHVKWGRQMPNISWQPWFGLPWRSGWSW